MRVLVVEDQARMATLLQRGLEEEGYAVDLVGNGQDAVWLGAEHDYDAIVLDIMLPGLDGIEVCRRLRAQARWAPILLLTARSHVADRVRGLDAGADDYLPKPFAFAELTARLRALIRRGHTPRPAVLRHGDLTLDPATHVVARGDVEISLTAKEFALLELLMRYPGEVLTRSRIVEHVWDFAGDPASNVIDQYIAYLRRKIDKPFGREDLVTVRGVGYRLRVPPSEAESSAATAG